MTQQNEETPKAQDRVVVVSNRLPQKKKNEETGEFVIKGSGGAWFVVSAIKPAAWVGSRETLTDKEWDELFAANPGLNEALGYEDFPSISPEDKKGFQIAPFRTKKSWQDSQYGRIANEVLWPFAHSMYPKTRGTAEELNHHYFNGYLPYNQLASERLNKLIKDKKIDTAKGDIIWVHDYQCTAMAPAVKEGAAAHIFTRHIPFPSLNFIDKVNLTTLMEQKEVNGEMQWLPIDASTPEGREKIKTIKEQIDFKPLKKDGKFEGRYAVDVDGKSLVIKEKAIPLTDCEFFRDSLEVFKEHAMLTFQRVNDQANFLMLMASLDGTEKFLYNNPEMAKLFQNKQGERLEFYDSDKQPNLEARKTIKENIVKALEIGTLQSFTVTSAEELKKVSTINVPAARSVKETIAAADAIQKKGLTESVFYDLDDIKEKFRKIHRKEPEYISGDKDLDNDAILYAKEKRDNFLELAGLGDKAADFSDKSPTLEQILEPIQGRKWITQAHRLEYTKAPLLKMKAFQNKMREWRDNNDPRAQTTSMVFPTPISREDVEGYAQLKEAFYKMRNELVAEFGKESVVIIPGGISPNEVLGMMRERSNRLLMGTGLKDGQDLTVKEGATVNQGHPMVIALSDQIGAADVISHKDEKGKYTKKGAYVLELEEEPEKLIPGSFDFEETARDKALKQFEDLYEYAITDDPKKIAEINKSMEYMKEQDLIHDVNSFNKTILDNYPKALKYRFGEAYENVPLYETEELLAQLGEQGKEYVKKPDYIREMTDPEGTAAWRKQMNEERADLVAERIEQQRAEYKERQQER